MALMKFSSHLFHTFQPLFGETHGAIRRFLPATLLREGLVRGIVVVPRCLALLQLVRRVTDSSYYLKRFQILVVQPFTRPFVFIFLALSITLSPT